VAIVSPYPGTTRDVIEVHLDLAGYPVVLLDTAGVRDTQDPVEQEGVRRARARAAEADLVLWLTDASGMNTDDLPEEVEKSEIWMVNNKSDLVVDKLCQRSESQSTAINRSFAISAKTGAGMEALVVALADYAKTYFAATESTVVTRARHRKALQDTMAALDRALRERAEELLAEELRSAAMTLGRLTGRVDVEDILDVIFRDFCIGK
jgi:tRNA modification GTPase